MEILLAMTGALSLPKPAFARRFAPRKDCPDSLSLHSGKTSDAATPPGW